MCQSYSKTQLRERFPLNLCNMKRDKPSRSCFLKLASLRLASKVALRLASLPPCPCLSYTHGRRTSDLLVQLFCNLSAVVSLLAMLLDVWHKGWRAWRLPKSLAKQVWWDEVGPSIYIFCGFNLSAIQHFHGKCGTWLLLIYQSLFIVMSIFRSIFQKLTIKLTSNNVNFYVNFRQKLTSKCQFSKKLTIKLEFWCFFNFSMSIFVENWPENWHQFLCHFLEIWPKNLTCWMSQI